MFVNSVANELTTTPDDKKFKGTATYLRDAASLARTLAPATPVALAIRTVPGAPKQKAYTKFDVIGFNHYLGWYPCPPAAQTSLSQLGPFIERLRSDYPRQGIVMSEFGAEATREGPATEKDTYAFQTDYLRKSLDIVDAHPYVAGAIWWALREFAVKPAWDGGACRPAAESTSIHRKGLLNYDGTPKPAWQAAKDRFSLVPVLGR